MRIAAALMAAGCLAGCVSDETAGSLLVAPGGFEFYSCPQLVQAAAGFRARAAELQRLMDKAERDPGGKLVSALGYRPDYLSVRGQLHEVERTARSKQCALPASSQTATSAAPAPPPPPSSRAMPGLVMPR